MAPRASLWLGTLSLVLLLGAISCLSAGIFLLTTAAASADSSGFASPENGQPVIGNDGNACSHEQENGDHGQRHGQCGDNAEHGSRQSGGDTTGNAESQGSDRSLPAAAPQRRSLPGGVALITVAALLLAASVALFVGARRRALLRPRAANPIAKPPATEEPRVPGVAVIEPPRELGPAMAQKSGLPPEYAAPIGPWGHPLPAQNPYYVPVPYGFPPPTYSEACEEPTG